MIFQVNDIYRIYIVSTNVEDNSDQPQILQGIQIDNRANTDEKWDKIHRKTGHNRRQQDRKQSEKHTIETEVQLYLSYVYDIINEIKCIKLIDNSSDPQCNESNELT